MNWNDDCDNVANAEELEGRYGYATYYINTVDNVDRIMGMDIFPSLPDEVENEV